MKAISFFLIVGAIALAVAMIAVSAVRELSVLELTLWQVLSLTLGLYGSYRFAQHNAREVARDIIRPQARSALRTLLSLRDSLYRLSGRIEDLKEEGPDVRLDVIQSIIHEQIPMGRSAVEDWRDVIPDDVDEVIERWDAEKKV